MGSSDDCIVGASCGLLRLRVSSFAFVVGDAEDFLKAARAAQCKLNAFFAQGQAALLAHLVAKLVARGAAVDHPPHLRRDLHHLVDTDTALEAAVVALRAADALAEGAAG